MDETASKNQDYSLNMTPNFHILGTETAVQQYREMGPLRSDEVMSLCSYDY